MKSNGDFKESYYEGKKGKNYHSSDAKHKDKLLSLRVHNFEYLNKKDHVIRGIAMLDSETFETLMTFESQYQAAVFITENIIQSNKPKKSYAVYGNLKQTMANGHRCYGYYWKILPTREMSNFSPLNQNGHIHVNTCYKVMRNGKVENVYNSMNLLSKHFNMEYPEKFRGKYSKKFKSSKDFSIKIGDKTIQLISINEYNSLRKSL